MPTRPSHDLVDSTEYEFLQTSLSYVFSATRRVIIFSRASHTETITHTENAARARAVAATALCSYAPDMHRCIAEVASRSRVLSSCDRSRFRHAHSRTSHTDAVLRSYHLNNFALLLSLRRGNLAALNFSAGNIAPSSHLS